MTEREFQNATIEELIDKYRFKTEEEFINEFGEDFSHKTLVYFNRGPAAMSLLYGMPLNSPYFSIRDKNESSIRVFDSRGTFTSGWIVTYDMLTLADHKALNKQKIKDKDTSRCMFNIEV